METTIYNLALAIGIMIGLLLGMFLIKFLNIIDWIKARKYYQNLADKEKDELYASLILIQEKYTTIAKNTNSSYFKKCANEWSSFINFLRKFSLN